MFFFLSLKDVVDEENTHIKRFLFFVLKEDNKVHKKDFFYCSFFLLKHESQDITALHTITNVNATEVSGVGLVEEQCSGESIGDAVNDVVHRFISNCPGTRVVSVCGSWLIDGEGLEAIESGSSAFLF